VAKENLFLAKTGEDEAADFLRKSGYRILARNYRTKLGEVDIIASEKGVLCFVEVKARSSQRYGYPQEAVSGFKKRQIAKTALIYLKENKLLDRRSRFDVVSVLFGQGAPAEPKVELIKDAFELDPDFTP